MKALVGAFNREKALVGAFSVIVQLVVEPMEHYTALQLTSLLADVTLGSAGPPVSGSSGSGQHGDRNRNTGVRPIYSQAGTHRQQVACPDRDGEVSAGPGSH